MLSEDEIKPETKPIRKSGQRKAKPAQEGKKTEPRKRKSAQRQDPQPDQLLEAAETITAPVMSAETAPNDTSPAETFLVEPVAAAEADPVSDQTIADQQQDPQPDQLLEAAETISASVTVTETAPNNTLPAEASPVVPVAAAEAAPVSYQTIADAYRNYTMESLDQTKSLFEKLAGVRSLDKAIELQTEFAKRAYDGFVTESRKIRELHTQMARQRMKHWEGFVARMMSPR